MQGAYNYGILWYMQTVKMCVNCISIITIGHANICAAWLYGHRRQKYFECWGGGPKMYDNQHTNFMPRPLINSSTGVYETRNATDNLWRSWKQVQADYDSHSCCVSAWWPPPGSIYSIPTAGAYEPPLAVKERVTCVPSKYKFKRGTGCGYPYMYMAIAYSNRRALSIFGKYCTWICISMAPRRTW